MKATSNSSHSSVTGWFSHAIPRAAVTGVLVTFPVEPSVAYEFHAKPPLPEPQESLLSVQIREHLDKWVHSTVFQSSPTAVLASPHFANARALGRDAMTRHLLDMLDTNPYHAVLGLGEVVKSVSMDEELDGDLEGLVDAWRDWGRDEFADDAAECISEFSDYAVG